jgi:hypothetical protein
VPDGFRDDRSESFRVPPRPLLELGSAERTKAHGFFLRDTSAHRRSPRIGLSSDGTYEAFVVSLINSSELKDKKRDSAKFIHQKSASAATHMLVVGKGDQSVAAEFHHGTL